MMSKIFAGLCATLLASPAIAAIECDAQWYCALNEECRMQAASYTITSTSASDDEVKITGDFPSDFVGRVSRFSSPRYLVITALLEDPRTVLNISVGPSSSYFTYHQLSNDTSNTWIATCSGEL